MLHLQVESAAVKSVKFHIEKSALTMLKKASVILVLTVGLVAQIPAWADWSVETNQDAMTDAVNKRAVIENAEGHSFTIYRISPDGEVWGNFALSDDSSDQVDWREPPVFRVDKGEPIDLARLKRLQEMDVGIHAYDWEPKWVNFLIWHGDENKGVNSAIANMMEGDYVVFRYHLNAGGYNEAMFSLEGAKGAISEALGISPTVDQSKLQTPQAFKRAFIEETRRCINAPETKDECRDIVVKCGTLANKNVHRFESCLQLERR